MKQLLATCVMAAFLSYSCNDGTETESTNTDGVYNTEADNTSVSYQTNPPERVTTDFEKNYPRASDANWAKYRVPPDVIDWEFTGWPAWDTSYYTVSFYEDGYNRWMFYSPEGDWLYSVFPIRIEDVPASVNSTINREFPGYTIESVNKENDKNKSAYEIKMIKGEEKIKVLIDEQGNVMKRKGPGDEKMKETN